MAYTYAQNLVNNALPTGDALEDLKESIAPTDDFDWADYLDFNVFGDPSISLTTGIKVGLSTTPAAPQNINTPITLTATPNGGGQVQYKFRAGYTDGVNWYWTDLTNYTTSPTCTWTPSAYQEYTLVVWARKVGDTVNYVDYAAIPYLITNIPAVSLSASPASPQLINSTITLTATQNITQEEYKFRVGYVNGSTWYWTDLTGYTTTMTCNWTPTTAQAYTLVVWARQIGHSNNYDTFQSISYQINLPSATLTASPASPQQINNTITLTASVPGATQLEYRFRAGYTIGTTWYWTGTQRLHFQRGMLLDPESLPGLHGGSVGATTRPYR